jgi:formamidopyrimidine-DNA glycosylase
VPELPEVETVRRMLERSVRGRTVRSVRLSGLKLRARVSPNLARRLRGRTIESLGRHGKYLLIGLDGGLTLISHLGMSGRWLFFPEAPVRALPHVHARLALAEGGQLWFQDPRRFGLLRLVATAALARDPSLRVLGPDPVLAPLSGSDLHAIARGSRVAIKIFLLDQRRIAGIGNIYASEILFRAGVDPRRRSGSLTRAEWDRVATEIPRVLEESIARMGTTFSAYRTLWGEPGSYGDQLRVYDRPGEPCPRCGTPIRRIVQGQRSTFFCPACQGRRRSNSAFRAG